MSKSGTRARMNELRDLLDQANYAYYVESQPMMSDLDYDKLMKELIELERQHPEFADPNSPSQRIGDQPVEGFKTVRHSVPMTSIDNTYSEDDLRAWHRRVLKGLGMDGESGGGEMFSKSKAVGFVCDPKVDGIAISLRYEKGALVQAVTRGDGEKGDEVTAQV